LFGEPELFAAVSSGLQVFMTRRFPVRSTSIASIGYSPVERELEIKFRESGDVYRYFDVPNEEYEAFIAAESKGTYLNQVFKPREYRYRLVSLGKKMHV
jgi:hypothetical protein